MTGEREFDRQPPELQAIAEYERRHRRRIMLNPDGLSIESIETGQTLAEVHAGDDESVIDVLHRVIGGEPERHE
jgi:hypothetical protein